MEQGRIERLGKKLSTISRRLLFAASLCVLSTGVQGQIFQKEVFFQSDSSKLKEVLHFTVSDTVLEGTYENFHLNGSLKTFGYYKNGLPDSSWIYYYENGRKRAEGKYREGKTSGFWTYYYESGAMKSEGILVDGVKNGSWTFYYENGGAKSAGDYKNDIKEGIWTYYFEDDKTRAQAYYENGSGIYKEFYPSGAVRMEGMNRNEKSNGKWTYFYESGEKEAEGSFRNGLRIGDWVYFYKNGNPRAVGMFNQGEESGVWKYFHEKGQLQASGKMKAGEREGFWKLYYPSGELRGEGSYQEGNGPYVEYYPSGKRKAEGQIKAGEKDGHWVFYNEEGLIEGEADYVNGIGSYTGYYPDGTVKTEGQLRDDKRVGEWRLYNSDGTLAGTHLSVYEEDEPIFKSRESASYEEKDPIDKPEYLVKRERLRYFRPRINEYRGIIVASNPFAPLAQSIPLSIEYYFQERLGYELQLMWRADPFFRSADNIERNTTYTRGTTAVIRQKFYQPDGRFGLFYFGHQLGFGQLNHFIRATDDLFLSEDIIRLSENQFYYGVFIGNRWMRQAGNSGFTIDGYIGVGAGVQTFTSHYDQNTYPNRFEGVLSDRSYFPLLFGLNFGWLGPKRTTTSQL